VFVIITDGQENSSKEYAKPQVKEMIERQRHIYKWQFTFLGADDSAFAEAEGLGIHREGTAVYRTSRVMGAFEAVASNVGRMRSASAAGETVYSAFTPEERETMLDKSETK
jgi:hypothetical protein